MTKTIHVTDELHKKLKQEAIVKDKTLEQLVEEKLRQ